MTAQCHLELELPHGAVGGEDWGTLARFVEPAAAAHRGWAPTTRQAVLDTLEQLYGHHGGVFRRLQELRAAPSIPAAHGPASSAQVEVEPGQRTAYDVFVSYTHRPPVGDWVAHFVGKLTDWLRLELGRDPQIFFDRRSVQHGEDAADATREALYASRCFVPIFSNAYFASASCLGELRTFQALAGGPIFAVLFQRVSSLPEEAKDLQWTDFRDFNVLGRAEGNVRFERAIRDFSNRIANAILRLTTLP